MKIKNKWMNNYIVLGGVIFITAIAYSSSLKNHLVADSWVFVFPHSFEETLSFFHKSIIPSEWGAFWLRPIPMLFFWLDNIIWPNTEWGPHLTNVFFHVLNVCLIWTLIRFIFKQSNSSIPFVNNTLPSFSACIIYGLHPLNVGSVGWVASRFDVMSITFGLLGMLTWFRYDAGIKSTLNITLSSFFLMCSILSKEQGIVFLIVCFLFGFYKIFTVESAYKKYWKSLTILVLMVFIYFVYRFYIFHGIGGYFGVQKGLSLVPPIAFFFAILIPFFNILPNWIFSITFLANLLFISMIITYMWIFPEKLHMDIKRIYKLSVAALFVIGLATTAPHSVMSFKDILGHAESRFALIPITGFSLVIGFAVNSFVQSKRRYRIILIIILIWGLSAAWRTDVQIQAWKDAGRTAHQIISETLTTVPVPPPQSQLLFFEIPRNNAQFAYIFGIGLKEAILRNYPGRNDIIIIPNSQGNDLDIVKPNRDYVFAFNKKIGKLERLLPQK